MKKLHQNRRNNDLRNNSKRFGSIIASLNEVKLGSWFNTFKAAKNFLNSGFERDHYIKFLLKSIENVLPTPVYLKSWKLIQEDRCLNCMETKTREHVLNAVCCRESLFTHIKSIFGKQKTSVFMNRGEQDLIVSQLQQTWSFRSALDIIDRGMLNLLQNLKFDVNHMAQFREECLRIGFLYEKKDVSNE